MEEMVDLASVNLGKQLYCLFQFYSWFSIKL